MLPHQFPFFFGERAGFQQNRVGNAEFPHVMQQGTASNLHQGLAFDVHERSETYRHIGDALTVALSLFVAQVKGRVTSLQSWHRAR